MVEDRLKKGSSVLAAETGRPARIRRERKNIAE